MFPYLVAAVVLLASALVALAVARSVADSEERAFNAAVESIKPLFSHRLDRYVDVLQGVRALFDASDEVTRAEFQNYVDSIELTRRFPGLEAIAFSRRLTQSEVSERRDQMLALSTNACGYPSTDTASRRGDNGYYIIDYVEPRPHHAALSGADALAEHACTRALQRAIASGRPASTERVVFAREGREVPGFMVLVPVEARGAAEQRLVAGVIIGYFLAPEVFGGILGQQAHPPTDYQLTAYAGPSTSPRLELYASGEDAPGYRSRFSALIPLEFAGREWRLSLRTLPRFHDPLNSRIHWLILGGGSVLAVALFTATRARARYDAERRRQAATMEHQSTHDPVTGSANRYLLERVLTSRLTESRGTADRLTLYYLDLDGFKEINNTLGHDVGDRLLTQIDRRLRHTIDREDLLARMGGDEFAVLSAGPPNQYAAIDRAKRFLTAVREPLQVESISLRLDASIGIAVAPTHAENPSLLLRRAEIAMYKAKRDKSGYALYSPDQDPHSPQRLALLGGLRHAMESGQFLLLYQPKFDLRTCRPVGVEALLRWNHPERGQLSPEEFIPLAEQTAFIQPLTAWVIDNAARQARTWRDQGFRVPVAVNISAHNLIDAHLPRHIANVLDAQRLPAELLELEITESALIADPDRAYAVLGRLHAYGLPIIIDDFGTGYSSLAYLRRLSASALKVDASFVRDMADDEDDATIVASTVQLAHNLSLRVIAEGVESEAIVQRLREIGCDQGQGFHLCRPLDATRATVYLAGKLSLSAP